MTVSRNAAVSFICVLAGSLAITLVLAALGQISWETLGAMITIHIVIYAASLILVFSRRVTGPIPDFICMMLTGSHRPTADSPRHRE